MGGAVDVERRDEVGLAVRPLATRGGALVRVRVRVRVGIGVSVRVGVRVRVRARVRVRVRARARVRVNPNLLEAAIEDVVGRVPHRARAHLGCVEG